MKIIVGAHQLLSHQKKQELLLLSATVPAVDRKQFFLLQQQHKLMMMVICTIMTRTKYRHPHLLHQDHLHINTLRHNRKYKNLPYLLHLQLYKACSQNDKKNKISSISERHSVLLRLCLVMLRLGERATWETDDTENAKEIDDLHALSKLLEAAQPSPVCASEHPPSSGPHAKRANSAYCFPADPNILCNLFTKTKIDSRLVRAISKRFQKEYEESHQVPPTNNSPEHDAVDDDSPRPTRNSLTNTFNKTNPTIFDSQPGEKRPSFVMRLFRTLRYPLRAIAMRRSKAPFVRTESKSLTHTADSRPSNDPERNTV
mmetsp:Transcript_11169/g.13960  ORF Transcript_11169/g.13960 Transcript_11169/m.13960 type:complete len:315 (-) Transcript_11169:218-1162(-)